MASESQTVNLRRRPAAKQRRPRWNIAGASFGISVVALLGAGASLWLTLRGRPTS